MFAREEFVFYGIHGVCQITAVQSCPFDKKDPRPYYVLKPIAATSGSILYAPADNPALPIRALMTKEDARALLCRMQEIPLLDGLPDKQRRDLCRAALNDLKPESYVKVIKTLGGRRVQLEADGKQLSSRESDLERSARSHLTAELAHVLECSIAEMSEKLTALLGV